MAREFYIRAHDKIKQINISYLKKIERNREEGLSNYANGKLQPFTGHYSEILKKSFNFIMEINDLSQEAIKIRIISPIKSLSEKHGISSIYAGEGDLAPHITLQTGNFINMISEEQQAMQSYLISNKSHLIWIGRILNGLSVNLDCLVLSGSVIYACTNSFTKENYPFYKARQLIKWRFTGKKDIDGIAYGSTKGQAKNQALVPIDYDDITHITAGRVTGNSQPEKLIDFARKAYDTVGKSLQKEPIQVSICGVNICNTYDFIREGAPKLIRE